MAIDKKGNVLFKFIAENFYGYGFREGLLPVSQVVEAKNGMRRNGDI
ncbi:MAG TPA: hypothetical protein PLK32_09255 [Defluviitoga tunisiensis]|nr:hypothetical protein [Defluviitoga tunisiensis]